MIIVTGAAGFIGSKTALHFSRKGIEAEDLILVDKLELFSNRTYVQSLTLPDKQNLIEAKDKFLDTLPNLKNIDLIVHLGAITNTAETNQGELDYWNTEYSKKIWEYCAEKKVPLIYASSAATYGDGTQGFSDDHTHIKNLKPLNLYGKSKQSFDVWVLEQIETKRATPPSWYGLKFFNVYGPHEDHKDRMASAVWHGYHEIKTTGKITLFESHNSHFENGAQARDFIYIEDVLKIMDFMIDKKPESGIYNCGTGHAATFLNLAKDLFGLHESELGNRIKWVPTPEQFRAAYQYKTEADISKLERAGFHAPLAILSEGIAQYMSYLKKKD